MNSRTILPFYMTYPLPIYYQEEDSVMRDLEYLQQMYPAEAKRYQRIIADFLDKMDYEGSMIYDEYPDRWQMYRISQLILEEIKKKDAGQDPEEHTSPEKWKWINDTVQILLFYEIYKRRHTNRSGILRF